MKIFGDIEFKNEQDVKEYIARTYSEQIKQLENYEIILYVYFDSSSCEEEEFILLRDKITGIFYENYAYHCSCYGFENLFEPEETTVSSILMRECIIDPYTDTIKHFLKSFQN